MLPANISHTPAALLCEVAAHAGSKLDLAAADQMLLQGGTAKANFHFSETDSGRGDI